MNYSMTNIRPISSPSDPLYVSVASTIITPAVVSSPSVKAALDGTYFISSAGSQTVAANQFLLVQHTVPANTNRTIYIQRVSGGAITNTTIDILYNATFAAAGTSIAPINSNLGSSNSSVVTAKFLSSSAPDPTIGGTRINSIIQTGGPVVVDYEGRLVIPSTTSARTFYIRLANNTNQSNILSINVAWWELPS